MNLHTAFIGIVVGKNGPYRARIQPLNLIKQYGKKPVKQAILTDVPILKHVNHLEVYEEAGHDGHVRVTPIEVGDIVFCVCADRDITETKKGKSALPSLGHHEIKDAVVVGCL